MASRFRWIVQIVMWIGLVIVAAINIATLPAVRMVSIELLFAAVCVAVVAIRYRRVAAVRLINFVFTGALIFAMSQLGINAHLVRGF